MFSLKKSLSKFRYYEKISRVSKIARKFFVMNAFDGSLTIFGVLIASFFAGISDPVLILSVGIGASIAVCISGISGAFLTEAAERKRELKELEKSLLKKLDKTEIKKAFDFAVITSAIVDGVTPFLTILIILIPFLVSTYFALPVQIAYYISFALSIGTFFFLGIFMGKTAKENLLLTGLKFVLVGIICLFIIYLLLR